MKYVSILLLMAAFILPSTLYAQQNVTAPVDKDTTIWSGNNGSNDDPQLSNGAGSRIIVGINGLPSGGAKIMRSPIAFDLSAIPNNATITSATVQMNANIVAYNANKNANLAVPLDISLHRLTTDWGESTSDAIDGPGSGFAGPGGIAAATGDATWAANVLGTSTWTNPGGDFIAQASATNSIQTKGALSWASADITADVQAWVDGTNPHYGWMLIADETYDTCCYVVQFDSKEATSNQPQLVVEYTVQDDENPVAVCDDVTVKLNTNNDDFTLTGELLDGGSTDNIGVTSLTPNPTTVGVGDLGTTVSVTLMVGDGNGNTDTCNSSVFVTGVLDVNGDGAVSPADAVYVINRVGTADADADVDGVNDVTVDDVQAVINGIGTSYVSD